MKVDLGIWNNIFSVPTCIVDEHIVKCGSVQLKVLLYLLRYPGNEIPVEEIAYRLSLSNADVSDSLNYWISEGVIKDNKQTNQSIEESKSYNNKKNNIIENNIAIPTFKTFKTDTSDKKYDMSSSPAIKKLHNINQASNDSSYLDKTNKNKDNFFEFNPIAPRLTIKEAMDRIQNDENFKFLIDEIPQILKRNLTQTDIVVIVSFLDWTGMDIDLALMLVNYCVSINKTSAKAIEKEAYKWANQGIDTHEKAEAFIKENLNLAKIQQEVIYAFHKQYLTVREKTFVKKWVVDFKYNINMLKLAYEIALTRKGEKDFSYINGILLSWYKKGIKTPEEINDENRVKDLKNFSKKNKNYGIFKIEDSASFSLEDLKAKINN